MFPAQNMRVNGAAVQSDSTTFSTLLHTVLITLSINFYWLHTHRQDPNNLRLFVLGFGRVHLNQQHLWTKV